MQWIHSTHSSRRETRKRGWGKRHVFLSRSSLFFLSLLLKSFFLSHAQLLTVCLVRSSSMPQALLQFLILTTKPLTLEQQRMCLDSGKHIISLCQCQSKLKLIPGFNNFWNNYFKPLRCFKYPFRLPEKENVLYSSKESADISKWVLLAKLMGVENMFPLNNRSALSDSEI